MCEVLIKVYLFSYRMSTLAEKIKEIQERLLFQDVYNEEYFIFSIPSFAIFMSLVIRSLQPIVELTEEKAKGFFQSLDQENV